MRTLYRVLFGVFLLVSLALLGFMLLVLSASHGGAPSKCASNIRQMALGAVCYAGDKRFFPQLGARDPVTKKHASLRSTEVARTLIWYGYLDSHEVFVCPQSDDRYRPYAGADSKRWFWGGEARGNPQVPPAAGDGLEDPELVLTDELSYGWTRKPMNTMAGSRNVLGADRAIRREPSPEALPGEVGNHWGGVNVAHVDAATRWVGARAGQEISEEIGYVEGRFEDLTREPIPEPEPSELLQPLLGTLWLGLFAGLFYLGWIKRESATPD